MENSLDIELQFDNEPTSKYFSTAEFILGRIIFKPVRGLEVHILGLRLVLETRGKIGVQEKTLQEERFIINETIYKDERYSFPFKLYNERYETYKGRKVSFLIKVETFLRLTKASDDSILNKLDILAMYTPKEKTETARYLNFKNEHQVYKIHEGIEALAYKISWDNLPALAFTFLLGFAGYLSLTTFEFNTFIPFLIGFILLFRSGQYLLSSSTIGNILATFNETENNQLSLKLNNKFNWKQVNKVQIHYEVKEEVIDRRGTSDNKETTTILISKKQIVKTPNRLVEASFSLPKNQPATTKTGDARIYWQLVVKVWTFMNFQFTYKTEFTVTKERVLS